MRRTCCCSLFLPTILLLFVLGMAVCSANDSIVVFNEIMYHPADDGTPEWIELHNEMSIDEDISGWSLQGGIQFGFPADTVLAADGYLVISADPAALQLTTGYAGALGPTTGSLSNGGERIELLNNSGRVMSRMDYGDTAPWPVAADGSGAALARIRTESAVDEPENWWWSSQVGGTPGTQNFPSGNPPDFPIRFNEIAGADSGTFFVEISNATGAASADLGGMTIMSSGGGHFVFPSELLAAGSYRSLLQSELGFSPTVGEALFLYAADGLTVLDGGRVESLTRGRTTDEDRPWAYPDTPTPGAENVFSFHDEIVINEIMYHPIVDNAPEWIELYNTSGSPVDLGDWQITDGVDFVFPVATTLGPDQYLVVTNDTATMQSLYPAADIIGDFSRSLSNKSDRITLKDAGGNIADHVRYYDGERWPALPDGCRASLELRDPDADNTAPEAWGASDEGQHSEWKTYQYRAVAQPSAVGPDGQWHEFVMGLLAAGEILLDDITIFEDPDGARTPFIQNGTFETGMGLYGPHGWRIIGNHRTSEIIVDPDNATNHVLRLVASGPTEHIHNHAESTLPSGRTVTNGQEYEVSFRARWVAGSNQLNTRLYFSRVAHTTLIDAPTSAGTPGTLNSLYEANIGPTYRDLHHDPAVPAIGGPTTFSVVAEDPDGIAEVALRYSENGGAWNSLAMARTGNLFSATLPAFTTPTLTHFYIEGRDALAAISTFPRGGPDARALLQVGGEAATTDTLQKIRVIMKPEDAEFMHTDVNLMSNERLGCTVIYDEREIYYNVGVRLRASQRGRTDDRRLGFNVQFGADRLFRGIHETLSFDRLEPAPFVRPETLIHQGMNHAGGLISKYTDLMQLIAPWPSNTGPYDVHLAGFGSEFLDSILENGSDGTLFEYELIYYPTTTTDANPESLKLPDPDLVAGTEIVDLGTDKEQYRWNFLIKNNRAEDDYETLMEFARGLEDWQPGEPGLEDIIDVDQWLRAFAVATATGALDQYSAGYLHNAVFYVRPTDGRVLYFPKDLDAFHIPTAALVGSPDLAKMVAVPTYARLYYGHMLDLLTTSYNGTYMSPWADYYGDLLPHMNFPVYLQLVIDRRTFLLGELNAVAPQVPIEITTNDGTDFSVTAAAVTLEGTGWIDVREIRLASTGQDFNVTWVDAETWRVNVPLEFGANAVTLEAVGFQGDLVGSDTITITSLLEARPLRDYLRITELMYHPADPPVGSPFDTEDFEFIELRNTGTETLDLEGVRLTDGILFSFGNAQLAPGEYTVVVRDSAAFTSRYGSGIATIAGEYEGRLNNAGEQLALVDPLLKPILVFTYSDLWYPSTDGGGYSLVIANDRATTATWNLRSGWRAGEPLYGTPGQDEPSNASHWTQFR